jgi:hypothetical protein
MSALFATAIVVACAPPLPADAPAVAQVWLGRCGGCHTRVEPGTRSHAELEGALARHHKRVRLSDEEWTQMIDYLAKDRMSASK